MKGYYKTVAASKRFLPILFAVVAVWTIAGYYPAIHEMRFFDRVWMIVRKGPLTVNLVLFLFLYGVIADRYTKKMKKWQSWLIWGVGIIAVIMFFRFVGGYNTIFG